MAGDAVGRRNHDCAAVESEEMHLGLGGHRRQCEIVGRIAGHDVAADGALAADPDIGDIGPCLRQRGQSRPNLRRVRELVVGHQCAELQSSILFLDAIETVDTAQMDHLGNRDAKLHPVYHIDAAGHEYGARTGRCLQSHRFCPATRPVQPKFRDQLARTVHRKGSRRGERHHITPSTGISPPYHRCTAISPSATRPNSARPIPQSRTIAARTVAVSPAEEANMMI